MTVQEFYTSIGGDFKPIEARLCSVELIHRFLLKFVQETSYAELMAAIGNDDMEGAFNAAHTLRGIVANLSLHKLYDAMVDLTEALRPRSSDYDRALVDKVRECYEEVIRGIEQL